MSNTERFRRELSDGRTFAIRNWQRTVWDNETGHVYSGRTEINDHVILGLDNNIILEAWHPKARHGKGYYIILGKKEQGKGQGIDVGSNLMEVEYNDKTGEFKFAEFQAVEPTVVSAGAAHQELLRVKSFDNEGFSWEQVDRKLDVSTEFGLDEEKVKSEGRSLYGEEVVVKGNKYVGSKYIVVRDGDMIKVKCSSQDDDNTPRWDSSFKLSVSMEEIEKVYADPHSDFRRLRSLIDANLTMVNN